MPQPPASADDASGNPRVDAPAAGVWDTLAWRRVRLISGLVLLVYVTLHLLNAAAGLISLGVAEAMLRGLVVFWHGAVGGVLLYVALFVHMAMAFHALWERRSWHLPWVELTRLLLGLGIPLLLMTHVLGTRVAAELYGVDAPYARVMRVLWTPENGARQVVALAVTWVHGLIGLRMVLKGASRGRAWLPALTLVGWLLPMLALLGALNMGREIEWRRPPPPEGGLTAAQGGTLAQLADGLVALYLVALGMLFMARLVRRLRERVLLQPVTLHYPGQTVRVPAGWSVLEASRDHGIAHLSLCGGRARCSTCRVSVAEASEPLPRAGPAEKRTLRRVNAPPHVRLACQLRPVGTLRVTPLLTQAVSAAPEREEGCERDIAVLFVDLRQWTGLAEQQWPQDLVYLLDRYFALVGEAVREAGGLPNQFIGDSVMALFGLETDLPTACRQALDAASRIERALTQWGEEVRQAFGHSLNFGIGLHAGPAAVGRVGWGEQTTLSAVGDVVNIAARLQEQSKAARAHLVVSAYLAEQAGLDTTTARQVELTVRGRQSPMGVLIYGLAADVPTELKPVGAAG